MSTDQIMQIVYLGLLVVAIGGSFLVSNRNSMGKTLQQAAIWVLIFLGVIGAYGLWEDISRDVTGRQAMISENSIEVPRSRDGHYYLTLDVNDVPLRFVVDTGASQIVLSQADADRIGIDPDGLSYLSSAFTANGVVPTAGVTLGEVRLGTITDTGVPAVVNGGEMEMSLLGMTYLDRFARLEISNNNMVLTR